MNKLAYGFLLAFCLGYITNDFFHESKLSPIALAHAEVAGMNWADLQLDMDFRQAVEDVVEDCTVDNENISC